MLAKGCIEYCIAGKYGDVLIWWIGKFGGSLKYESLPHVQV